MDFRDRAGPCSPTGGHGRAENTLQRFCRNDAGLGAASPGDPLLFFVGIATNVCVELRSAMLTFHEYWPLLVTDGAMQAGPPSAHEATIFNVESFFGWTLRSGSLIESLVQSPWRVARGRAFAGCAARGASV